MRVYVKRFWRTAIFTCGLFLILYHVYNNPRMPLSSIDALQDTSGSTDPISIVDNRPIPPLVDWSQYAYSQYVTSEKHICQAVMMFESLSRLQSKADRIMLYPEDWVFKGRNDEVSRLMLKAQDEYSVKLVPVKIWSFGLGTWADGFTKFLIFNQTQYKRVLGLDSDATLLQNMDELFFLPATRIALCHGYWYPNLSFSGQLMLVEPSTAELDRILISIQSERLEEDWDTEVLNRLYWHDALYIPARPYDLITRDFRGLAPDHFGYLGNHDESWDPDRILAEAKYVHFSDWPLPKPWVEPTPQQVEDNQPRCFEKASTGEMDCRDREAWLSLYEDFGRRRERICGARYEPRFMPT